MERIQNPSKQNLKKDKEEDKGKKGQIKVRNKKNGKEARVTLQLNIPGVQNPRLARYGATEEIARKRLADAIVLEYVKLKKSIGIADAQVFSPECQEELEKFDEYMDIIKQNMIAASGLKEKKDNENLYPISDFAQKMLIEKKKQSEIKVVRRRKKITPKTVTYYVRTVNSKPFSVFKDLNARTVKKEELQELFDNLDYSIKYLKDVRLALKLTFDIVIKEKIRLDNPAIGINLGNSSKLIGIEIEHLEQDRQEVWLDIIEKDKRQWAYLFEAILLTGARPEEGCGFKWNAIDFEKDIVHIKNAYQDNILYDDNMNPIGHYRGDSDLKTPESVRDIPLHPRLKRLLLMIKANRMAEYLKKGKQLDENEYIFLNNNGEPYIPERLTRKMPEFIKKYNLEHLTVYGLRHSFATLCSTFGMPPEVLHVIMGHTDFETTRRYYIHISEERKRNEMIKMFLKQTSEPELLKLQEESDIYYNKVINLKIQDIRPTDKIAC